MTTKTFLVTGASHGIGLETARALAMKGHRVLLVARTEEKGQLAREEILRTRPDAAIEIFHGDLGLLREVRRVGEEVCERHEVLDGLVNTVGVWMSDYVLTEEGIETVFATNHLSYFLLTHEVYPLLRRAGQARVVNVSSNSHKYARIRLDDPGISTHYHGLRSYGQSKLANMYFTFEFNARRPDPGISSYAVSPGLVKTDIGLKHTTWLHGLAWKVRCRNGQTPAEGARTSVFCASDPAVARQSGLYWEDCHPREVFDSARHPEVGRALWDLSLALCGIDDYFHSGPGTRPNYSRSIQPVLPRVLA